MSNPFSKINIFVIVSDHISTLKDYGRTQKSKFDLILFFVFPLIVSTSVVTFSFQLNNEFSNLLITVLSIFAGLLFNLQILMFDIIGKQSKIGNAPNYVNSVQSLSRRIRILENVSFNISFEILLCILGVIFLATSTASSNQVFQAIVSLISFYIIGLFFLTLAMVLKRVHVLLSDEIEIQKAVIRGDNSASH